MNIEKLKELLTNKLAALNNRLNSANLSGHIEEVILLETEIAETINTLTQLNTI